MAEASHSTAEVHELNHHIFSKVHAAGSAVILQDPAAGTDEVVKKGEVSTTAFTSSKVPDVSFLTNTEDTAANVDV